MREEEREKINRCLVVSLTNATSSRGSSQPIIKCMIYLSVCSSDSPRKRSNDSFERNAPEKERERDKDNKGGREIYIYPLTMTLRKATRVTFERQDDAMNYKMMVKAKVSSGFADTKEKDGRERERERDMKHGVRKV